MDSIFDSPNLENSEFDILVTLLDYETSILEVFKYINLPSTSGKIIIDTFLSQGMNKYRFLETDIADLKGNARYINVNDDFLSMANMIIKSQPVFLENSILTQSQIQALKEI